MDLLRDREAGHVRRLAEGASRDRGDLPGPGRRLRRRRPRRAPRTRSRSPTGGISTTTCASTWRRRWPGTAPAWKNPLPNRSREPPAAEEPQPDLQQAAIAAAARRAEDSALAVRTRQRYEQVQALRAQGKGIKPIMRETGLAKETVRRFYRAAHRRRAARQGQGRPAVAPGRPQALPAPAVERGLHQRPPAARRAHATAATRAATAPSATTCSRSARPAPPRPPSPARRKPVTWPAGSSADPDHLDDDEKAKLAQARERCPHLDALAGHVTEFAKILTGRHGDRLDDWITAVEADDQPDLHSFVRGIKRDHDAVLNGLTLPWSSGVVEGNVNRVKMIKRQMYGRAAFPLLRKRVLLAS